MVQTTSTDSSTLPTVPGLQTLAELARGAGAVVYRAERDGKAYALKVQREPDEDNARDGALAFRREAAALACVHHQSLPEIYEVGEVQGRPYLVMELVEGPRLGDVLEAAPLSQAKLVAVATEIAQALAVAHRRGIVHRDVKPDNIILASGRAKLVDFGLAGQAGTVTDDAVAGTMLYCSPEQGGMISRPVDGRSDLYSLGAVLHECATGTPPFGSVDVGELLRMHAVAAPPDILTARPELSPALAMIIARLLAKDPDDRYQTAEGLVADLQALAGGEADDPEWRPGRSDDVATIVHDFPLVGRSTEMGRLLDAWNSARSGRGCVVSIEGAPGSGKSRLARELLSRARSDGALVLQGKSEQGHPVPLAPLREALNAHVRGFSRLPADEADAAVARLRKAAGRDAAALAGLSPGLGEALGVAMGDIARQDQLTTAVIGLLIELSRSAGMLVLAIDDVQWLDDGTLKVVQQLALELEGAPLLVLCTARDDPDGIEGVVRFRREAGRALQTYVSLGPLDDEAMRELVLAQLGGAMIDDAPAQQLLVRSNGNPLAAVEYLRAILNAGLLTPSWGRCVVDQAGLERLALPEDVLDLVLARIDVLGAQAHRILAAGAVVGTHFEIPLVAQVLGLDESTVAAAIGNAMRERLIEPTAAGVLFVHDRIRQALLSSVPVQELADTHQRIAELLEQREGSSADHVFALAHHYVQGGRSPEKILVTCAAAGKAALSERSGGQAQNYFEQAVIAARAAGAQLDGEIEAMFAEACHLTGDVEEADRHFAAALELVRDPWRRAKLRLLIGRFQRSMVKPTAALEQVEMGLGEAGHRAPRRMLPLALAALWSVLRAGACRRSRIGYGTATGEKRDRMETLIALYELGGLACYLRMEPLKTALYAFRQLYPAYRLEPASTVRVRAHASLGTLAALFRLRRRAHRIMSRCKAMAEQIGDPELIAYFGLMRAITLEFLGESIPATDECAALMRGHARWLETGSLVDVAIIGSWDLHIRGYAAEALALLEKGSERVRKSEAGEREIDILIPMEVLSAAMLGRAAHNAERLDQAATRMEESGDPSRQVGLHGTVACLGFERGDYELFEQEIARHEQLGYSPLIISLFLRHIFVYKAMRRLMQYEADRSDTTRAAAKRAMRELRLAADHPALRAHFLLARATLAQIDGSSRKAMALLTRAERKTYRIDAPLVRFGVFVVRARVLLAQGHRQEAMREARIAIGLAVEHGWKPREQAVRAEFGVDTKSGASSPSTRTSGHAAVGSRQHRHLQALHEVSVAASTVLDPTELARIALDEIVRILGAERALLFLCREGTEELELSVGRDTDGNELESVSNYSTTLVDRVRCSGEALVVTGSEEGAALGSESVVVHGLRSIVVAPMRFEGRLLGVLYLDSRLAKAIFTEDDVDILLAITNHVAVSMETARAAQLEVTVQSERRQRALAEALHGSLVEVAASLDPDEVLARMLASVSGHVPNHAAVVLLLSGEELRVAAQAGEISASIEAELAARSSPLEKLLDATAPVVVADTALEEALPLKIMAEIRSWLALPLRVRDDAIGLLVLVSRTPGALDDSQAEIAAAFAGQGLVAYENAMLFSKLERLATTDELTGVNNRRNFFKLADRELSAVKRHGRQLAAIMLDIDHFKRFNDAYGHATGDTVLRAVAARLHDCLRTEDLLGRYGGEEFAILLPDTGDTAEVVAERLRQTIAFEPIATDDGDLSVTISLGVAVLNSGDHDLEALLRSADEALYEAKEQGRNRYSIAPAFV